MTYHRNPARIHAAEPAVTSFLITETNNVAITAPTREPAANKASCAAGFSHYVAVALRNDGHWEDTHHTDDFKHKPIPKSTECGVQILFIH